MLVARIIAAVREPIRLGNGGEEVSAGISIGVATYSDEISSVTDLLAHADGSLHQARSLKESRWLVFGKLFNIRMANTGNRIIVASQQPLPDKR